MACLHEIVTAVAKAEKMKRTVVDEISRAYLREIQLALETDGDAHIQGFGRFTVRQMPDRIGTDFKTGRRIEVAGKRTVRFTPSVSDA